MAKSLKSILLHVDAKKNFWRLTDRFHQPLLADHAPISGGVVMIEHLPARTETAGYDIFEARSRPPGSQAKAPLPIAERVAGDGLLTIRETGDFIGASVNTVRSMIANGVLTAVKSGRRFVRVRGSSVAAFVQRSESASVAEGV